MLDKRRKINKEKVSCEETCDKKNYSEKLRERIEKAYKVRLDYVFTFGKYRGDKMKYVCDVDPSYIQWLMRKKVLDLAQEAINYYVGSQRQTDKKEKRQQEKQRQKARRERRERTNYKYTAHDFGEQTYWQNASRQSFNSGNRTQRQTAQSQVSAKIVTPASQWDHLPKRERAGKILGLHGKITKGELRALYRKRMLEYHPDKVSCLGEELQKLAHEMSLRINEAYDYFKEVYDL